MMEESGNPKQKALGSIGRMLDDATWEDILYRVYVLTKVERGREDFRAGRVLSNEEVMREIDDLLFSLSRQEEVDQFWKGHP